MIHESGALRMGTVGNAASYWRADLTDLVTLVQLKLTPRESRPESTAQHYNAIEAEIKTWAVAKPVLAARRLGADGTRGIRMGDVSDLYDRLISSGDSLMRDPTREPTIAARANHSLGIDPDRWVSVLAND